MCLDYLCKSDGIPANGVAYKGLHPVAEGLWSSLFMDLAPFDEWLTASDETINCSSNDQKYWSGFHCYTNIADCWGYWWFVRKPFSIAKVQYKGLQCVGHQDGKQVLVARQILVESARVFSQGRENTVQRYARISGMVKHFWYPSERFLIREIPESDLAPVLFDQATNEVFIL